MSLIELKCVSKYYESEGERVPALQELSLNVEGGEFMAVMGHSGSGKSTLLNVLGGLSHPSAGEFCVDDINIYGLKSEKLADFRREYIGFVFQSFNLLRRTSALENVALPLLYGDGHNAKARAMEQLKRVGLAKRATHHPNQLSGGEQQRVAIARSLINNPAILLTDEPTGNLDSRSSNEIMNLLQELNIQGITILVVTHERDVAECCEKIVFFRDGQMQNEEKIIHRRRVKPQPVAERELSK